MITWLSKSTQAVNKPFFEANKYIQEVHLDISKYPDLNKQLQNVHARKPTKENINNGGS